MHIEIPSDAREGNWADRARAAGRYIDQLSQLTGELSRLRREALEEAKRDGVPQAKMARELNLASSRISRILSAGVPPERALVSPDGAPVTIAVGSKMTSAGDGAPAEHLSKAAIAAYEVLAGACSDWQVAVQREIVGPPGLIDMNRNALVVMGSPKVLPLVGQVAASDQNIAWGEDTQGRYLHDQNSDQKHRAERGVRDVAYVGRLPRPDGKGHFLYIAGIHAPGTHAGARWVVDHAAEIHAEVGKRPFSTLVTAGLDGDEITSIERSAPIYTR